MVKTSLKMLIAAFLFSSIIAVANETPAQDGQEAVIAEQMEMSSSDMCTEAQNECMDKCDGLDDENAKDGCYNNCDVAFENCLAQQDK